MPCLAVNELIGFLETVKLVPTVAAAKKYWQHIRMHGGGLKAMAEGMGSASPQPVFLYGDAAEYTKYADHLLGVYMGSLDGPACTYILYICIYC